MKNMRRVVLSAMFAGAGFCFAGQTTDQDLKQDMAEFGQSWIYDDLNAGYAESRKSGKPLMAVFRCVP